MEFQPLVYMRRFWWSGDVLPTWLVQLIGVGLAILLIYMIGLLVGNLIGRTVAPGGAGGDAHPAGPRDLPGRQAGHRLPPGRCKAQFEGSRVVAVQRDAVNVWSIGLVTGGGVRSLNESVGGDMVTCSSPRRRPRSAATSWWCPGTPWWNCR